MKKTIKVKASMRKGKMVKAHTRTIDARSLAYIVGEQDVANKHFKTLRTNPVSETIYRAGHNNADSAIQKLLNKGHKMKAIQKALDDYRAKKSLKKVD